MLKFLAITGQRRFTQIGLGIIAATVLVVFLSFVVLYTGLAMRGGVSGYLEAIIDLGIIALGFIFCLLSLQQFLRSRQRLVYLLFSNLFLAISLVHIFRLLFGRLP